MVADRASGRARRRRRPWLRIVLVLAIAVLVWFYFDGRLPRFGVEEDRGAGVADNAPRIVPTGMPVPGSAGTVAQDASGAPREPSDAELGRRQRLDYLIESARRDGAALEDARRLATTMRDTTTVDADRAHASRYLGPDGVLARVAGEILDRALANEDIEKAARALSTLESLGAGAAIRDRGLSIAAASDAERGEAWTRLEEALDGSLPLDLGATGQLIRCDDGAFVLRQRGTAGGFRFHRLGVEDMDPRVLRRALVERFADLKDATKPPLEELARLFESHGEGLAARFIRRGTLAKD